MICGIDAVLSEGNGPILLDRAPQTILPDGFGNDVDRSPQDGFKAVTELIDASEIRKPGCIVRQPHNHIHVGIVAIIAAGRGADQGQAGDARSSQLRLVRAQLGDDFVLYHAP
jgi:hypothetical protein